MGKVVDLIYNLKKYGKPTMLEIRNFIITILVLAFIISFRDWGKGEEVEISAGLINFFIAAFIVTISLFIHHLANRAASLSVGYRAEYKITAWGLLLAVVLAILSRGHFWYLIVGGVFVHHIAGLRLGQFRYGLNYFGTGLTAAMGAIASLVFAIFLKIVYNSFPFPIIHKAFIFNLLFAVYMILPIPPAHGNRMFFGSRMVYAFIFCLIIAGAILLYIDIPIWLMLIGTIVIAFVCWILNYVFFEVTNWQGPYPK